MEIEDKLFCLKYELETLSNVYFYNKAERWVKGFLHPIYENEHLDRYNFAKDFVKDKLVLDIAGGSGYGTCFLASEGNAAKVISVDLDLEAVKYASLNYNVENIERFVEDANKFKYSEKFDVIVSFETIEHIPDYEEFVNNLLFNLKDDGIILISTPISLFTNKKPANSYHFIEWSFSDFRKIFEEKFNILDVYVQDVVIEVKKWQEPSIIKKIKNRLFKDEDIYQIQGKRFEKFTGQYDMDKCISGYQVLVLTKK